MIMLHMNRLINHLWDLLANIVLLTKLVFIEIRNVALWIIAYLMLTLNKSHCAFC